MATRTIDDAVRELTLYLPETTEVVAHGSPNFKVAGKTFATFSVNHHGDGNIALWLAMGPGAQAYHVEMEPEFYFVPPYVGSRGWVGIHLNKGMRWRTIGERIQEAWVWCAPPRLKAERPPPVPVVTGVSKRVASERADPFGPAHVKRVITHLRHFCLALPETDESTAFGNPVWRAGKKTFAQAWRYDGNLTLGFWVGVDRQDVLIMDKRYSIPAYMGHNGWIGLNAEKGFNAEEVEQLTLDSYRHFALKRMLAVLDSA